MSDLCPCASGKPFVDCCEAILNGTRQAATPTELMRARYAAFATHNIDFLFASSGEAVRKDFDADSTRRWAEGSEWTGLDIISSEGGTGDDIEGTVEFVAHYSVNGQAFDHHERSLFQKIDGQWKFIDGVIVKQQPIRRETPRVGRNDPCPCGSGKKFKHCCGK